MKYSECATHLDLLKSNLILVDRSTGYNSYNNIGLELVEHKSDIVIGYIMSRYLIYLFD